MDKQQELLDLLVQKNLIRQDQVENLTKEAAKRKLSISDLILDKKLVNTEELTKTKAIIYGFPYENLLDKKIKEDTLKTISSEVAENYKIICFDKDDKILKIGMLDPANFKAIEAVDFLAKEEHLHPEFYIISPDSFNVAFKQYQTLAKELSFALQSKEEEDKIVKTEGDDEFNLEAMTKSAPVIKIVSVIIRHAIEGRASDIHIEPTLTESRVRYRIDGVLHTSLVLPKDIHNAIIARIKVMANMKLDETRKPQDGRIRLYINNKIIDFRVSLLPLLGMEKVVMRILDVTKGAPKLEDLGYQGRNLRVIMNSIKKTEGIFLVTGPTGSGKSTTLFAIISMLNKEDVNISTLEDPVEYLIEGVNQSQIKPEIGYTFATGLRAFLRQDPNIIMVGEIRDQETAELGIHAALTGHLVFSTLHTIDSVGAIGRLIDMHVEPFLLGCTLHTVLAQRLCRRICEYCKMETRIPKEYYEEIKTVGSELEPQILEVMPNFDKNNIKIYKGKGCPRCANTGYLGRFGIAEVLDVTPQMQDEIKDGKRFFSLKELKENQQFITTREDGIIKVIQGSTTIEEVIRVMEA